MTHPVGAPPRALTIAGSDSGGAAGLQADLKTFTTLGVYGMSVVTVITAQNSIEVRDVQTLSASLVAAQLSAVLDDYGAQAIKTGFIGSVELITTIARHLRAYRQKRQVSVVVDPVLVNFRGEPMFSGSVSAAYSRLLFPLADLVTPNCHEAELLAATEVATPAGMAAAARRLHTLGAKRVLVTGGRDGAEVVDVYYDDAGAVELRSPWIVTDNRHGSGDTLSAAIAAFLAHGLPLDEAVARAHAFTARAIDGATHWQLGDGHGPLNHLDR